MENQFDDLCAVVEQMFAFRVAFMGMAQGNHGRPPIGIFYSAGTELNCFAPVHGESEGQSNIPCQAQIFFCHVTE